MNKIKKLRKLIKVYKLDGYIVPKNDEFFGEHVEKSKDRLNYISSFSGSAGNALILAKKCYDIMRNAYLTLAKQTEY